MKRILFALSLLLVLVISNNAFSESPKTTYNKAEVELLVEKKAIEINKETRAEIKDLEEGLWKKVGIELDQSREELEDARAMLSRKLDDAKTQLEESRATFNKWLAILAIILSILIGVGGIVLPIFFSRKMREAGDYVRDVKKEIRRSRDEAEKILEKIKDVHYEAKNKLKEIKLAQPLTADQKEAVKEVAADEKAPIKDGLLAQALKAQDEDRWNEALKLWRALDIVEPRKLQTLFGIARSIQEFSDKTGKDEGLEEAVAIYKELYKRDLAGNKEAVLSNWGNALADQASSKDKKEADSLFEEAYGKYKEVIGINPDYYRTFDNWGYTLFQQARTNDGKEADKLFEKAKEKCLKAEAIKVGSGSYNLACFAAVQGRGKECKDWLEKVITRKNPPTYKHMNEDKDFDNVREEQWFKDFLEELRKEEKEAKKS